MRKRRLSRLLTVLLSVGLLVQNMPLTVLADTLLTAAEDSAVKDEAADADSAGAAETQNTNIVFDTDELSDALIQAVEEKTIVKKTYSFTGYVAEDYEQLFDTDYEDLYELRALERKEGDLTVRVFARLDEDGFAMEDEASAELDDADETDLSEATMSVATEEDSDPYMITGNEQIIFLLLNNTVSPKSAHIEMDGRVSPEIKILTAKQIKKQLSDDDDDDDEASTPDTSADSSDAVDHPSDNDGATPTTGDTANADAPSSDGDGSTPTTGDTVNADAPSSDGAGTTPTTDDTADAGNPSSDGADTTPTTGGTSDAGNPSSENDAAPASSDTIPTTGDATSFTGDTTSTAVAAAANVDDTTPVSFASTNAATTPATDGTTPTGDTAITTGDGSTGTDGTPTTTDGTTGADNPATPTGDTAIATGDTTSTTNGTTPTGDTSITTGDGTTGADGTATTSGGTTPTTNGTTPTGDTAITTGDGTAPAGDGTTGTDGTPTTAGATTPTGDETTGTGDATTPAGDSPLDPSQPNLVDPSLVPPADLAQATPNEIPKPGTAGMPDPEKQEKNEEATLLGDLYESVLFKKTPATAFVVTLSQFMDYEIALLDVGDENIVKVTGTMNWSDVQNQIDDILKARSNAEIKIQGQGDGARIIMTGLVDDVDNSDGGLWYFKAWNLHSDTIIENVTLELPGTKSANYQPNVAIFANGHNFTVERNVQVVYTGQNPKSMYIFGGGNEEIVDSTHLEIKGGDWERVYGGSYKANAGNAYVYVAGPKGLDGQGTDAGDAAVLYTFGGCYRGVTTGNIHVLYGANRRFYLRMEDSRSGPSNVFGSGHDMANTDAVADVTGDEMRIDILDGAIVSDISGGYNSNLHCKDIYLHVAAGAHVAETTHGAAVCGGTSTSKKIGGLYPAREYAPNGKQYTAYSKIHLTFDGEGKLEDQKFYKTTVMGGGTFSHVEGNIEVIINGNTEYVYGGSSSGNVTGDINVTIYGNVLAGSHNADAVIGDVTDTWFGGTVQGGCMQGDVTGNVTTTIGSNASVHAVIGGCDDGGVDGDTSVRVYGTILKEGYKNANRFLSGAGCVFGAGYLGESSYIDETDVTGTSSVYIYPGSNVQGDVYGGGLTARASGGTHVEVSAPIGGDVYGGSWLEYYTNIIKAAELSDDGLSFVYKEKELGYVGGEKADTYVELNRVASASNVYGGSRGTNVKGSSTVVLKDQAKAMNVYGTGNAITNGWSGGEEYTFGPLPITTSGDATIRIEDSAVVKDTIYGYDIVTPKDEKGNDLEPHKLLTGKASVLFDRSNSDSSFKRVKNADFVHLTDTSAVAIDNDHKDEEQLVNVGDLNIDADSALTLGASAHIYGNYQGGPDKEKSAKLIIPAGKRLTADGTVTQFTKISIYDFDKVVPAEKQVYVVSGAGSKTDTGDFIWVDERNGVTMEWNMHSASGETKAEKPTMWWLVKQPTQPKPDPKPDPKPSGGGGGGGGGSRVVPGSRAVITTPEPGRVLGVNRTPETAPETKPQTGRVLGASRRVPTGDMSLIAVWFTLMLIAMAAYLGFIVYNRRWRRHH